MLRDQPIGDERRGLSFDAAGINIRNLGGTAPPRFDGYASVFDSRTAIGNPLTWGFYEEIANGAFSKTLQEGDARMLIDHDSYYVVSRVSAGTLNLREDSRGLLTDSALDERLSYVGDLMINVDNRNITGMSFGFRVVKDDWDMETVSTSDGQSAEVEVRTIREVKLIEVSAVTFPAYEETTAGLRNSLVPALLRRNDPAAIARAAQYRPDLAPYLGYDEDLAATRIYMDGKQISKIVADEVKSDGTAPEGEILGTDADITAVGNVMTPTEESNSEPVDTTREDGGSETNSADKDSTEPVEPTRNAPSDSALAEVKLKVLRAQLRN